MPTYKFTVKEEIKMCNFDCPFFHKEQDIQETSGGYVMRNIPGKRWCFNGEGRELKRGVKPDWCKLEKVSD